MARTAALLSLTLALVAAQGDNNPQQGECTGDSSMCPNSMDGVSPTYLQCDSWSQTYMPMLCPIGTVCFSNPNRPGTAMCGMPGSGGIPDQGTCSGNTAKCKDPGSTGDYYQCDRWSSYYVNATCPPGLKCHNNTISTGVYCE